MKLAFGHIFVKRLRPIANFYLAVNISKRQNREGSRAGELAEERKG